MGAKGYAARLTFSKANDKKMNIAAQWQDADSSVTDHLPNAKVMICSRHASGAHKKQKQLEKLWKMKSFTADLIKKYKDNFLLAMWSVITQGV